MTSQGVGQAGLSASVVAALCACGCGIMGVSVDVPGVRTRVVVDVPTPAVTVEVPPPTREVVVAPAPAAPPMTAGMMPVMPNMGGFRAPHLPAAQREQAWARFMARPPLRFHPKFLTSRLAIDPQVAAVMGIPTTVRFNPRTVLANLVLVASLTPQFTLTNWSAGPGPNDYSVTFNADGQPFTLTFSYDPATDLTRALMTVDGETHDAWPLVWGMGLMSVEEEAPAVQ